MAAVQWGLGISGFIARWACWCWRHQSKRCAACIAYFFATASLLTYVALGRAVRCLLPLNTFMHLVVLYGYQGADNSAEQLQLTDQLVDAASGELAVVARGQSCLVVGDFNVEPTKIPSLATKGLSAGLWVDLEASWAFASGREPAVTCKRTWVSGSGIRRDFQIGCPLCAAAVRCCCVLPLRLIQPHLAVRSGLLLRDGLPTVTQPVRFTLHPSYRRLRSLGIPNLLRSRESERSTKRDYN